MRVSAHKGVAALCHAWGGALVSTSANPAGSRPATAQFQVQRYFHKQLDVCCLEHLVVPADLQ